jgi:hypothetical protein
MKATNDKLKLRQPLPSLDASLPLQAARAVRELSQVLPPNCENGLAVGIDSEIRCVLLNASPPPLPQPHP